jgi:hypothetical protein
MKIYIFILFTLPEFGKASVVKDALISCHRSRDRRFSGNADGRDRWLERLMWRPPQKIKWKPAPGEWPSREQALASRLFSPLRAGPLELATRTWVPAMMPWRATDDGFVTQDNVDWYARFAAGRPGAIVVEATGIRDVPSGRLLRIGHDRFVPGLRRLVEAVREASGGETKLFIQLIDFLSIRRRPEPAKFLGRHLAITGRHRRALGLVDAPEAEVRSALLALPEARLAEVLDARELEALRMGARERVTDLELPHVRALPAVLPGLFADARPPGARRGLRRRRTALRARLHDGIVPVRAEYAHRRLRRLARESPATAARGLRARTRRDRKRQLGWDNVEGAHSPLETPVRAGCVARQGVLPAFRRPNAEGGAREPCSPSIRRCCRLTNPRESRSRNLAMADGYPDSLAQDASGRHAQPLSRFRIR